MTLRLAVVGCGAIARRAHLPAFRRAGTEAVDIVAFASRSRASAEAAQAEWGGGAVADDWREVVGRDDVDAVDVCSPNRSHAEIAVAALQAGKHVLVEKPLACTLAEADTVLAAAERAGKVVGVAHNARFSPAFYTAHRVVARGDIGRVVGYRAAFGHAGPRGWAPDADWFFDPAQSGGGALMDLGIHVADLIRFVVPDPPVAAAAFLAMGPDGVDEAAQVVLRSAGSALGSLHASWVARPGPDHQLTVFGTEATLHVDGRGGPTVHRPGGAPEPVERERPPVDLYRGFVEACSEGRAAPVTGQEGRAALAIVEAAYRSAQSGRAEPIDDM